MFQVNNAYGDDAKYLISLDELDLALLPLPLRILNRNDNDDTIPIWRPNNFLENNDTYIEFEVYTRTKNDDKELENASNEKQADNIETLNNEEKENARMSTEEEIDLASYIKILTALNESHPKHMLRAINNNILEITTVNGQKVQVSVDNFQGFVTTNGETLCRVCRVLVGRVKGSHKLTKTHLRLIMVPLRDANCCRKLDNVWSHCVLCNEIIENVHHHCQQPKHKSQLKKASKETALENMGFCTNRNGSQKNKEPQGNNQKGQSKKYYCWTCNIFLTHNDRNIKEHNNGSWHKAKLSEKAAKVRAITKKDIPASCSYTPPKTDSIITRTETTEYSNDKQIPCKLSLKDNEVYCSICQMKMLKGNIESHLQGRIHKINAGASKTDCGFNVAGNITNNIPETHKSNTKPHPVKANANEMSDAYKIKEKIVVNTNKDFENPVAVNLSNIKECNEVSAGIKQVDPQSSTTVNHNKILEFNKIEANKKKDSERPVAVHQRNITKQVAFQSSTSTQNKIAEVINIEDTIEVSKNKDNRNIVAVNQSNITKQVASQSNTNANQRKIAEVHKIKDSIKANKNKDGGNPVAVNHITKQVASQSNTNANQTKIAEEHKIKDSVEANKNKDGGNPVAVNQSNITEIYKVDGRKKQVAPNPNFEASVLPNQYQAQTSSTPACSTLGTHNKVAELPNSSRRMNTKNKRETDLDTASLIVEPNSSETIELDAGCADWCCVCF